MTKNELNQLLSEYQNYKGTRRRYIKGDSEDIKLLQIYITTTLNEISEDDQLTGDDLRGLYDLVVARVERSTPQYALKHSLTNHIYCKLIHLFARDHYQALRLKQQQLEAESPSQEAPVQLIGLLGWTTSATINTAAWLAHSIRGLTNSVFRKLSVCINNQENTAHQPPVLSPSSCLQNVNVINNSTIDIEQIKLEPTKYPWVINDFSYQAVFGNVNQRTDIYWSKLEAISPCELYLTSDNKIISLEELKSRFSRDLVIGDPEAVNRTNGGFSHGELARLMKSKPTFFTKLKVQYLLNRTNNFMMIDLLITKIHEVGLKMRNDRSYGYSSTVETGAYCYTSNCDLIQFFIYIASDQVSPQARASLNALADFKRLKTAVFKSSGGMCRHEVGEYLMRIAHQLRAQKEINMKSFEKKYKVSHDDVDRSFQRYGNNGLKVM